MSIVRCPCCNQPVTQVRTVPLSEYEAQRCFEALQRLGHTRESLLRRHRRALDHIAPGMVAWLRCQPNPPGYAPPLAA